MWWWVIWGWVVCVCGQETHCEIGCCGWYLLLLCIHHLSSGMCLVYYIGILLMHIYVGLGGLRCMGWLCLWMWVSCVWRSPSWWGFCGLWYLSNLLYCWLLFQLWISCLDGSCWSLFVWCVAGVIDYQDIIDVADVCCNFVFPEQVCKMGVF